MEIQQISNIGIGTVFSVTPLLQNDIHALSVYVAGTTFCSSHPPSPGTHKHIAWCIKGHCLLEARVCCNTIWLG